MRFICTICSVAMLSLGFQLATSVDVEAAGKKRMSSKTYCPPMTSRR